MKCDKDQLPENSPASLLKSTTNGLGTLLFGSKNLKKNIKLFHKQFEQTGQNHQEPPTTEISMGGCSTSRQGVIASHPPKSVIIINQRILTLKKIVIASSHTICVTARIKQKVEISG